MELRHLRYAVALAESGNFTRAAERLHISQPTLSVQIRALERLVGAELFERLPNGVRVTTAGEVFLTHARVALAAADDAVGAVRAAMPATAPVRVGCFRAPWSSWAIADALHPDDRQQAVETITVGTTEGMALLLDGKLDVLVGQDFTSVPLQLPEGVDRHEVATEHVWLALGGRHRLARRPRLTIADLVDENWLVLTSQPDLHELTVAVCRNYGRFEPRQVPVHAGDELPTALVELRGVCLCTPMVRRVGGLTTRDIGLPEQRRIFVARVRAKTSREQALRIGGSVARLHADHTARSPAGRARRGPTTIERPAPLAAAARDHDGTEPMR
ncbi:LysR family transcriptional regulator [Micromonospora sp. BQ11]|uniref:LysR family transcriptional regulator n=1 Tax=Micromonospora sp. BQ11 TaxID=3452212 RepID=UPI003F8A3BA3